MKYLALFTTCIFLCASAAQAKPVKYTFDKEHTAIMFMINHLGFSNKIGLFRDYDGYFIFDEQEPTNSKVEISIKPGGIETGSAALDKELQNDKWFNTAKYKDITFKSSKINVTGKNTADIIGWVKFMGKEKATTLHVTFNKAGEHPMSKKQVAGFSAEAEINRSDFGMNNGVPFVGEDVKFHIEVEGIQAE
jgi:polyisoprenoid-binding protein YceI